jgi:hypothetical protein
MARRPVSAPRSRFIAAGLGISFALSLAVILILLTFGVRLGQGYFAYRFSPLRDLRTPRALMALPIVVLAGGAVYLLSQSASRLRRMGMAFFVLTWLAAAAWAWWAPPSPLLQHMFNFTSPSSDGAFFVEASSIRSIPRYLAEFPQHVRQQTPESMRGTRVLSNPPGMTLLIRSILPEQTEGRSGGWLDEALASRGDIDRPDVWLFADTTRVAVALCILWALAGVAAYALARVFLSPAGAATFAIIATFNPATLHFVPGKDPAQLLAINLMLWAWFAGQKQRKLWPLCGLAGAILVIGSTFSLIHIWAAVAVLLATYWQRQPLRKPTLAAISGGLLIGLLAWLALGWNIPLTLWAVARKWSEIQKTFEMSRPIWYLIGLPIFLLFLSPGFWTLLGLSVRRRRLNFGTKLFLSTLFVMLFTYFVIGMTYELPRLWVAFLPLLTLGLAIDFPLLRARGNHPRVARVLMLIVLVQMIYTTFHWTLFDVRETEYRLLSKRYYH